MKKIAFLLLLSLSIGLASCLKETDNEPQFYGIGVVQSTTSGFWVQTDDDHVLYGSATSSTNKYVVGDRVYFLYTEVRKGAENEEYDYLVRWDEIIPIRTKPIQVINDVSRDTIGTDGIRINTVWITKDYLNVHFTLWVNNKTHYLNLVYDEQSQNVEGAMVLEFKHDANNDVQYNAFTSIYSFDLTSIPWQGTPPYKIVFRYKNYSDSVINLDRTYTPVTNNTQE
jgi:hypothetical protein